MNKPNINIKDILGKLSFLKNNLSLLVPIIIVVIALLLFIPTHLLSAKLHSTIEQESVRTAQRIESLKRQVDGAVEAQASAEYIEALAQDANEIEQRMLQSTQRELLRYGVFPDTNESSILLFEQFGRRYQAGLESLLASLNAGEPPTDSEVTAALENAPRSPFNRGGRRSTRTMTRSTRSSNTARNRSYMSRMMVGTDRKIVDMLCLEKAQSAGVYADVANLGGYSYWEDWTFGTRDDAFRECWYWQLGYWVIEDIVASIREMNAGFDSLVDAPVKRLMNVSFTFEKMGRSMRRGGARRRVGARKSRVGRTSHPYPTYVTSSQDGMTTPCTGRYTNDEIDVIHFEMQIVVSAKDAMAFIDELCSAKEHTFRGWYGDLPPETYEHNQITVLESSMGPIEYQEPEHDPFRYGDDPVIDLDLICEYVLVKAAYEEIKPKQVKQDILDAADTGTKR